MRLVILITNSSNFLWANSCMFRGHDRSEATPTSMNSWPFRDREIPLPCFAAMTGAKRPRLPWIRDHFVTERFHYPCFAAVTGAKRPRLPWIRDREIPLPVTGAKRPDFHDFVTGSSTRDGSCYSLEHLHHHDFSEHPRILRRPLFTPRPNDLKLTEF